MQELQVVDSFRVRENPQTRLAEVRGYALHLERFRASVQRVDPRLKHETEAFLRNATVQIERHSTGWPRLEFRSTGVDSARADSWSFDLKLRPLPPLQDAVEMRSTVVTDVKWPELKGPNIDRYAAINRELGAEALLTSSDGHAVEGATTSLLWWHRGALCTVADAHRVKSVTEQLVARLAAAKPRAIPLREVRAVEKAHIDELKSCEVWAVNAVHGIRVVTSIDGSPLPPHDAERLSQYRAALDTTWQALAAAMATSPTPGAGI